MKPVRRKTVAAVVETGAVAAAAVNGAGIAGRRTGSTYLNQRLGRLNSAAQAGLCPPLRASSSAGSEGQQRRNQTPGSKTLRSFVCIPGQAD